MVDKQYQQNNDSNNKSPNEKVTKAYKLFDEGKIDYFHLSIEDSGIVRQCS